MVEDWEELGDRVFRRRHESLDLNVGLVVGDEHVLVVDSRAHHEQADELLAAVRRVTPRPVTVLVNTHHHWDHTFGNARFGGVEIVAHRRCRQRLVDEGEETREELLGAAWIPVDDRELIADVVITPPTRVLDDQLTLELGGRSACLAHLGRGHTDNDVVVAVDDVLFAGDLVEEGAPPAFGDSYPRDWVDTLDRLLTSIADVVVPGHGDVVDRDFVVGQRDAIARAVAGEDVFPSEVMALLRSRS